MEGSVDYCNSTRWTVGCVRSEHNILCTLLRPPLPHNAAFYRSTQSVLRPSRQSKAGMFSSIFTSSSSLTGASHPPNEWHPKSSQTQPSVDQGWHVLGFLPAADNFLFQKVLGRVLFRLVPTKPIVLTTHCWRWWCWWSVKTVNCSDHGNDDDDHDHAVSLLPVHWTSVESDKTLVWPNALSVITPCRSTMDG